MTILLQGFMHDINITFPELIQILIFLGGIVGVWIAVKIRIAKLETSTAIELAAIRRELDLQIKAIDSKTVGLADFLSIRLAEFVTSNKEDHNTIKDSVDNITKMVNHINIEIAKITPYQHNP